MEAAAPNAGAPKAGGCEAAAPNAGAAPTAEGAAPKAPGDAPNGCEAGAGVVEGKENEVAAAGEAAAPKPEKELVAGCAGAAPNADGWEGAAPNPPNAPWAGAGAPNAPLAAAPKELAPKAGDAAAPPPPNGAEPGAGGGRRASGVGDEGGGRHAPAGAEAPKPKEGAAGAAPPKLGWVGAAPKAPACAGAPKPGCAPNGLAAGCVGGAEPKAPGAGEPNIVVSAAQGRAGFKPALRAAPDVRTINESSDRSINTLYGDVRRAPPTSRTTTDEDRTDLRPARPARRRTAERMNVRQTDRPSVRSAVSCSVCVLRCPSYFLLAYFQQRPSRVYAVSLTSRVVPCCNGCAMEEPRPRESRRLSVGAPSFPPPPPPGVEHPRPATPQGAAPFLDDYSDTTSTPTAGSSVDHVEQLGRRSPAIQDSARTIFVGGLPPSADVEDLRHYFRCFGPLSVVRVRPAWAPVQPADAHPSPSPAHPRHSDRPLQALRLCELPERGGRGGGSVHAGVELPRCALIATRAALSPRADSVAACPSAAPQASL